MGHAFVVALKPSYQDERGLVGLDGFRVCE